MVDRGVDPATVVLWAEEDCAVFTTCCSPYCSSSYMEREGGRERGRGGGGGRCGAPAKRVLI